MRGVARFGSGPSGDPLSYLDDDFLGPALDPKWTIRKPASMGAMTFSGAGMNVQIVDGGAGPTNSFWFDDNDGLLIWQPITGDFVVECFVAARDRVNSAPAPLAGFNVAGIAAHNPAEAPLPTGFNYVHVGPASNNTASLQSECKSTAASVSTFDYTAESTGEQWVQLTRIGQVFSCAYRLSPTDPWIPRTIYNRAVSLPTLPDTLWVGPIVYSSVVGADLSGTFRAFTVRTP